MQPRLPWTTSSLAQRWPVASRTRWRLPAAWYAASEPGPGAVLRMGAGPAPPPLSLSRRALVGRYAGCPARYARGASGTAEAALRARIPQTERGDRCRLG